MDGTVFDIKQFAIHDGPGIRTTVFFKGCPLNCAWCHNPESRCPEPEQLVSRRRLTVQGDSSAGTRTVGCRVSVETVLREISRDRVFYDESGGGVTFSGGEPMMQIDFLRELLRCCHEQKIHAAVDTSGHADWSDFEKIVDLAGMFLYDLKLMDDTLHQEYVGVSNRQILENLVRLNDYGTCTVVRVPAIPGITDTDDNMRLLADFLEPQAHLRRIDILPYNKFGEDKALRYGLKRREVLRRPESDSRLREIQVYLQDRGFEVRIGG